jgi:hypothetical protein
MFATRIIMFATHIIMFATHSDILITIFFYQWFIKIEMPKLNYGNEKKQQYYNKCDVIAEIAWYYRQRQIMLQHFRPSPLKVSELLPPNIVTRIHTIMC